MMKRLSVFLSSEKLNCFQTSKKQQKNFAAFTLSDIGNMNCSVFCVTAMIQAYIHMPSR